MSALPFGLLHVTLAVARTGPNAANIVCASSKCSSDIDCSLNGKCDDTASCICDSGWTGNCCQHLRLAPVDYKVTGGGYRHSHTSTWGGNIIQNGSSYHMWIAEMAPKGSPSDPGAGSCGLTSWQTNSQITHVVSAAGPEGPYLRHEVAVGVWSHNPLVRRMSDGTLVMYHIGSGTGGSPHFCAGNGTSPCGEQSFDKCNPNPDGPASKDARQRTIAAAAQPPSTWSSSPCKLMMHTSRTTEGPWEPFFDATITPCAGNNPAPWVHPNGTVYVVFTEQNMGLWRAESWQGPYTLVTTGACGGGACRRCTRCAAQSCPIARRDDPWGRSVVSEHCEYCRLAPFVHAWSYVIALPDVLSAH
jgi:hypothetical protein